MFRFRRYRRKRRASISIPLAPNPNSRAWRAQQLRTLSQTPTLYYAVVFKDPASPFVLNLYRLNELIYYCDPSFLETDEFKKHFSKRACELWAMTSTKDTRYGYARLHNKDFANMLAHAQAYLTEEAKSELVNIFVTNCKNFNPSAKKIMAGLATTFVKQEDAKALEVLSAFLRNLTAEGVGTLLKKIPNGLENPDVEKILKKTKMLGYLTFNEQDFNNNPKERERMVKAIGKTPTLIKRLPFEMKLTLDDLNNIAPAMRFDFVQFAFKYEHKYIRWGYTGTNLISRVSWWKQKDKSDKLVMPMLTVEQMKELLFSVCLKKNTEFAAWMEFYSKYTVAIATPDKLRQDY